MKGFVEFIAESNRIEGIFREPTAAEENAHWTLLEQPLMSVSVLNAFQSVIAPGNSLRDLFGLDVRVGNYIAPAGGPGIVRQLRKLCEDVNRIGAEEGAWRCHVRFEVLHPYMDGNGRTGRALWAWAMKAIGHDPFALPFLHRFYYQTLAAQG